MKKLLLLLTLFIVGARVSNSQNVGIGISGPLQKLHVSDGSLPNLATIRVDGLSSSSALAAGLGPYAVVMVDADGVMFRGGSAGSGYNNAWMILGNAGTVAGTNFIGTTDAQDFVTKTGGSASANERMRVIGSGATPGQVVINNPGIFPGDVFSVYANNTTNGTTNSITNNIGTYAVNGYASGNGTGVYGETDGGASTSGTAVWGNIFATNTPASTASDAVWGSNSTAPLGSGGTSGTSTGVRGEALGAAGTAVTIGVLGLNIGTAGSAYGVFGQTSSPGGMGVVGINTDVSQNFSHGIQGQTGANGGAAGIRGYNTAAAIGAGQSGFGVRGSVAVAPTGTGYVIGVRGDVTATTGTTYGVYGLASSSTGFGEVAVNTHTSGTALLAVGNNAAGTYIGGGSGAALNGTNVGCVSIGKTAASGTGLVAVGNNLTGSIYTLVGGSGLSAIGTQYGVIGFATTTVNTNGSNTANVNLAAGSAGGYFEVQNLSTAQAWAYVGVRDNSGTLRKVIGTGTVNTIVRDMQDNLVALSCPEAPENLFQDYGVGELVNGSAHITLDPVFSKNIVVNAQHPLRVFIQLEGDCEGVYVTAKTQFGFEVKELNSGNSNVPFSYTVVANRADEINPDGSVARYSDERFAPAPGPASKQLMESFEIEDEAARKDLGDQNPNSSVAMPAKGTVKNR